MSRADIQSFKFKVKKKLIGRKINLRTATTKPQHVPDIHRKSKTLQLLDSAMQLNDPKANFKFDPILMTLSTVAPVGIDASCLDRDNR